jgi:hypothetical protein
MTLKHQHSSNRWNRLVHLLDKGVKFLDAGTPSCKFVCRDSSLMCHMSHVGQFLRSAQQKFKKMFKKLFKNY